MNTIPQTSTIHTVDNRARFLIEGLNSLLPGFLRQLGAPGVQIALAHRGNLIWEAAYGYADVASRQPMATDTVFRSGSMGKVYTAVAIMQLVEQGIIALEDPVNRYLPFEVNNPLGSTEVTIFHLMTHTSGLSGDAAGGTFGEPSTLEDYLQRCFAREYQPLMGKVPTWSTPPGQARVYSNIGISTLGLIVERTNSDKLAYADYVQRYIMQRLDMQSTQYPVLDSKDFIRPDLMQRLSTGYNSMGNVWIPSADLRFEGTPAGAFYSIPRDHLRLFMAMNNAGQLDGEKILQPKTVGAMLSPQLSVPFMHGAAEMPRESQGLVWWLRDWEQETRAYYHGGGHMYGWHTMGMGWPEYEAGVVFAFNEWSCTNSRAYYLSVIENYIEGWLRSEPRLSAAPSPAIQALPWKCSYLRGLLYVESYRWGVGVLETLGSEEAARLAGQATMQRWGRADDPLWDANAFLEGVQDMNGVAPRTEEIQSFARHRMRIDLEEARRIMPLLGDGGGLASLAGLLAES